MLFLFSDELSSLPLGKILGFDEICEQLNVNRVQVNHKARTLKIKRPSELIPEGFKKCSECKTIVPISFFNKRRAICKPCLKSRANNKEDRNIITKQCTDCKEVKEITKFITNNATSSGYGAVCKDCHYEKIRVRNLLGGY